MYVSMQIKLYFHYYFQRGLPAIDLLTQLRQLTFRWGGGKFLRIFDVFLVLKNSHFSRCQFLPRNHYMLTSLSCLIVGGLITKVIMFSKVCLWGGGVIINCNSVFSKKGIIKWATGGGGGAQ